MVHALVESCAKAFRKSPDQLSEIGPNSDRERCKEHLFLASSGCVWYFTVETYDKKLHFPVRGSGKFRMLFTIVSDSRHFQLAICIQLLTRNPMFRSEITNSDIQRPKNRSRESRFLIVQFVMICLHFIMLYLFCLLRVSLGFGDLFDFGCEFYAYTFRAIGIQQIGQTSTNPNNCPLEDNRADFAKLLMNNHS